MVNFNSILTFDFTYKTLFLCFFSCSDPSRMLDHDKKERTTTAQEHSWPLFHYYCLIKVKENKILSTYQISLFVRYCVEIGIS